MGDAGTGDPRRRPPGRLRGGERLRGALRGLLARRPVRRVLLATAAKMFF